MTAVSAPFAEALASNKEDVALYLELARSIYNQAMKLQRDTASVGGKFSVASVPTLEEAASRANALLNSGKRAGYEGVEYAHAYWQSLKHPWYDQIVRQNSDAAAGRSRSNSLEKSRLEEIATMASSAFGVKVEVDRLTVTAPGEPTGGWATKVAESLQGILKAAREENIPALRQTLDGSARMHPQERLLALEGFRMSLEQDAKQRHLQEALRAYQASQTQLSAERIQQQLGRARRRVGEMESEAAGELDHELDDIASLLSNEGATPALETRVEALERKVIQQVRQQSLVEAAVAALRQQGYETVQIMQTLGPPEIASVYLQDLKDDSRVALLQVAPGRGMLATEIIRREDANGSQREKQLDHEAQSRLCKAVEAMEAALAAKWQCAVVKRVDAGSAAPKVRKDIPARNRKVRVASVLKTRSVV